MRKTRRAVVLGGSWFVGRAIVESLLRREYHVIIVNRGISQVSYSGHVERLAADRQQTSNYTEILRGIDASYLVDVTAYRARDTSAVLEAFRDRLVRIVHISTLSVYRLPVPCPVPEDWPLERDPTHEYGFHKAECERVLFSEPLERFPWTILRLPPVYGPGDPISREHYFCQRILEGRPVIIPERPFLCQNVFIDDVADACCRLLESPHAVGGVYNIGASPFTLEAYLKLLASLFKRPFNVAKTGRNYLERRGIDPSRIPYYFEGDLVLKTTRLSDEVGFTPSVTLKQGLSKTIKSGWPTNPLFEGSWDASL